MASRLQDVLLRGLSADKPLATDVANGTLYYSTDTATTEQSDGTAWQPYNDGGGGGGIPNAGGAFLSSGGVVTWIVGYDFDVSAAVYFIQGVQYTSLNQQITLDPADPTNPRLDIIGVDNTGTVFKVTGVAAVNPSEPDINPGTQLKLSIVLVPALSTEPTVTEEVLYFDNVGGPTEWNWTTSGSGFNVNSTNNPKSPSTKDIEGTAVANGAYTQGAKASGTVDPNSFGNLIIYIRSKATWANNRGLTVTLRLGGAQIGVAININRTGTFGFNSSITADYQLVAIPLVNFAVPAGILCDQIRVTAFGAGHGFYLDDIKFQGGGIGQTVSGITQAEGDARYLQRANNLSDVTSPATARANLGITGSGLAEIVIEIDGNGAVITTGIKGFLPIPFACTILEWTLLSTDAAATAGSIIMDIWKDIFANYPPTVADTITAAAKPTLSAANKAQSSTLTGWNPNIAANDVLGWKVDTVSTLTKATLILKVQMV
jgi:hypothetical protein